MSTASSNALPVHLSTGGSGDLDGVMEVMTTAFDGGFGEGWSRSQCAGILPLSGVVLTVARDAGGRPRLLAAARRRRRVGIAAARRPPRRPAPRHRRPLIDHFIDTSRASGATRLHLEVRDGNRATAMYQAFGFAPAGRRTNYYRGNDGRLFDAVTMVLDLNND